MFLKPKLEVISGDDFEMIHQATLRLLEDTGIVFHRDEVLKIFKDHGAAIDGVHRCHFAGISTTGKRKTPGTLCSGPVKPTKRFWQPRRIP